jgi:hypothetical protein
MDKKQIVGKTGTGEVREQVKQKNIELGGGTERRGKYPAKRVHPRKKNIVLNRKKCDGIWDSEGKKRDKNVNDIAEHKAEV